MKQTTRITKQKQEEEEGGGGGRGRAHPSAANCDSARSFHSLVHVEGPRCSRHVVLCAVTSSRATLHSRVRNSEQRSCTTVNALLLFCDVTSSREHFQNSLIKFIRDSERFFFFFCFFVVFFIGAVWLL